MEPIYVELIVGDNALLISPELAAALASGLANVFVFESNIHYKIMQGYVPDLKQTKNMVKMEFVRHNDIKWIEVEKKPAQEANILSIDPDKHPF